MKAAHAVITIILLAALFSGCNNKPSKCYPGGVCNNYQIYNRCGSSLKYECEDICRQCKAYEPQCYSCYACIESTPENCLKKYENASVCPK